MLLMLHPSTLFLLVKPSISFSLQLTIDATSGPSVQGNRSKVPFKGHLSLLQKQ